VICTELPCLLSINLGSA